MTHTQHKSDPPDGPSSPPADRFMATEQLAVMVNTTERTLLQLRRDGGGPAYVRIGAQPRSRVMYRYDDVLAWIASRTFADRAAEAKAVA